jgi:hypothetical protein
MRRLSACFEGRGSPFTAKEKGRRKNSGGLSILKNVSG